MRRAAFFFRFCARDDGSLFPGADRYDVNAFNELLEKAWQMRQPEDEEGAEVLHAQVLDGAFGDWATESARRRAIGHAFQRLLIGEEVEAV